MPDLEHFSNFYYFLVTETAFTSTRAWPSARRSAAQPSTTHHSARRATFRLRPSKSSVCSDSTNSKLGLVTIDEWNFGPKKPKNENPPWKWKLTSYVKWGTLEIYVKSIYSQSFFYLTSMWRKGGWDKIPLILYKTSLTVKVTF